MEDHPQRPGASLTFAPGGILVDALTNDPDFTRIQQFVTERVSTGEGTIDVDTTVPEAELNRYTKFQCTYMCMYMYMYCN